ncbi:B-cell receptor CD22 isoform X2 [Trachinotus anak]
MKDGKWNEKDNDFTGTIIYSANDSIRPVSLDFVDRVKYIGSSTSKWKDWNSVRKPLCSILICNLKKSDSGEYSFRFVGNSKTQTWMTKKNVILKVQENPCLLTFQKPPAVNESDTIKLTCSTLSSCSSNPQIQDFQSPPKPFSTSPHVDKKSTTIHFTASWEDDGKVFSCQTEDNTDKYFIQNITVTVEYGPRDILAPSSQTVKEGDLVTLTCSAKGNPQPIFSWVKGEEVQSSGANWTITSIQYSQSGEYHCKAQNKHGVKSQSVVITVTYAPRVEIKMTPLMSDVKDGDQIILTCTVTRSNPEPTAYSVLRDGYRVSRTWKHVVQSIEPEDSGNYTCQASNAVGIGKSEQLEIKVQYRPRNTHISIPGLNTGKVRVGSPLTFICNTEAYPPPHTYSWHRYNNDKQIDTSWWTSSTFNENRHHVRSVERADEACYTCNATNWIGPGDKSDKFCIEVLYPPTTPTVSMPDEVTEGQLITITCTVESKPLSTLTLEKTSTLAPWPSAIIEGGIRNTLQHTFNVTSTHTGFYTCSATNSEGSSHSEPRNLVVKYTPKDVTVTSQPGLVVKENTLLTLYCSSRSHPPETSVTWVKMTDRKDETIMKTKRLTIKSAAPSDSGLYRCDATNEIGTGKSKPVEVKVMYAPKHTNITRSAVKQERDGRSSVTLRCSSQSYPPISKYFWYKKINSKERDELVSMNQIYTVYSNQPGVYYCIAKNDINEKSSDPVELFNRDIVMILKIFFLCLAILLIIFSVILVYRYRRKKSIPQGTTNTHQPFLGSLGWWNGTRRGNLMNETVLAEPFRSRDDLLPDQPCRPRAQRRQPYPDSTPASNNNTVYSTVNLPHGKQMSQAAAAQKPTRQQGGHTQDDSLNYASLHFWNTPNNKQAQAQDDVYAKVSKRKPHKKNEQGELQDYENVSVQHAHQSPNPSSDDSDTSEGEVDLNYTQVSFTPKPGRQRANTDSSTSDEDEIQYSDVKI